MQISQLSILILTTWTAVALFFSGFLLSKRDILTRSHVSRAPATPAAACDCLSQDVQCHCASSVWSLRGESFLTEMREPETSSRKGSHGKGKRKVKKIFFFIVDALRLDFMTFRSTTSSHGTLNSSSYNNFQYMHNLLLENTTQCALFGFRADPPTTTSQRLKGMMTGGLPAFVEIGANFNSAEVMEDSLVSQWQDQQRRVVLLGDDTWLQLFPRGFSVARPFDSFNTRDLNTVDDGIMRHLLPMLGERGYSLSSPALMSSSVPKEICESDVDVEVEAVDWDVFIAHFLGVDHIGHTYSAHHPAMGERLRRMDGVLENVIERLKSEQDGEGGDTLLMMFGDHGMTDAGEHGGNSLEETLSGLFVYSTGPLFSPTPRSSRSWRAEDNEEKEANEEASSLSWCPSSGSFHSQLVSSSLQHPRVINQVDLAPTIALLQGMPVPYTSLGQIVPELFHSGDLAAAYRENARQVMRYLMHYFLPDHCISLDPPFSPEQWGGDEAIDRYRLEVEACMCAENIEEREREESCSIQAAAAAVQQASPPSTIPFGGCASSSPSSGITGSTFSSLSSWSGNVLRQEMYRLYDIYYRARVTHQFLELLVSSSPLPRNRWLVLSMEATQKQTNKLYADFLSSCLAFSRVQWSYFHVPLMVCGFVLCLLCFLWSLLRVKAALLIRPCSIMSSWPFSSYAALALLTFQWLTPLSNSFIAAEPNSLFFTTQVLSLLRILEIAVAFVHHNKLGKGFFDAAGSPATQQKQGGGAQITCNRSTNLLCGAMGMEVCALGIARWLLHIWRSSEDASDEYEQAAGGALVWLLLADVVGPLVMFVSSFWVITVGVSFLAAKFSSKTAVVEISWHQWAVTERIASKVLFVIASVALLPHCLLYHTPLLDGDSVISRDVSSPMGAWMTVLLAHKHQLQICLPCLVLSCGVAGIVLECVQLLAQKGKGMVVQATGQHFQSSLHLFVHLSAVVILVSVSVRHHVALLVTGQLWFSVSLISSLLLVTLARTEYRREEGRKENPGISLEEHSQQRLENLICTRELTAQHVLQLSVQLSVMGRLLFFMSNHKYDFGTMQLSAGMVGVESFHFWYAGSLVGLNTSGFSLLGHISLLALAAAAQAGLSCAKDRRLRDTGRDIVLGVSCSSRMGVLLGSLLSALLLRRHLMLWAVFAPKVIFEAVFWILDSFCLFLIHSSLASWVSPRQHSVNLYGEVL